MLLFLLYTFAFKVIFFLCFFFCRILFYHENDTRNFYTFAVSLIQVTRMTYGHRNFHFVSII